MPAELSKPEFVAGVICVIGGAYMLLSRLGLLRISLGRNGGSNSNPGPHPISPEALSKITALRRDVEEKYLTREKHEDVCMIACLEQRDYISKTLEAHTLKVIAAIQAQASGAKR